MNGVNFLYFTVYVTNVELCWDDLKCDANCKSIITHCCVSSNA